MMYATYGQQKPATKPLNLGVPHLEPCGRAWKPSQARKPREVGGEQQKKRWKCQVSNEKNPGWLGYVGDSTTQLYRDYNKPL